MKQFILSLIVILILGSANAQFQYESPHVKDGKTIQLTFPAGYFEVANTNFVGYSAYASQEGLDFDVDKVEELPISAIAVLHMPTDEKTFETFVDDFKKDVISGEEDITITEESEIVDVKGRDWMFAGVKGEIRGNKVAGVYFAITEFGDHFVIVSYYMNAQLTELLDFEEFKTIISTWNEVETDKKNGLDEVVMKIAPRENPDFNEEFYSEGYEMPPPPVIKGMSERVVGSFLNDKFETTITFYDVVPGQAGNWYVPKNRNSHLLFELVYNENYELVYKENHGSVKMFSGGSASNYPSTVEMGKAIQLVIPISGELDIIYDSQFSNEDHTFKAYTISNGGTITLVYTTLVNDELVFFVVDGGSDPAPDLKQLALDLVSDMMIRSSEN